MYVIRWKTSNEYLEKIYSSGNVSWSYKRCEAKLFENVNEVKKYVIKNGWAHNANYDDFMECYCRIEFIHPLNCQKERNK